MTHDVSLLAAFVAGVFSLLSPCVLPLVPIYLAHLAGATTSGDGGTSRARVFSHACAYVLGFSAVFILLGVALGAAGAMVGTASFVAGNRVWLVRLGGVLLVLLGLQQIGVVQWPFLNREHRLSSSQLPAGRLTSSFVVGMTFGAGWSPCVGPVLGAILTMASSQGSPERAAVLLSGYSAGLGIPFLLAASLATAPGIIRRINRHLSTINTISGTAMLAVGAILLLGFYQQFFARMVALAPWTPWEPSL
jgi:cytochrome c-type biogenesis protein